MSSSLIEHVNKYITRAKAKIRVQGGAQESAEGGLSLLLIDRAFEVSLVKHQGYKKGLVKAAIAQLF